MKQYINTFWANALFTMVVSIVSFKLFHHYANLENAGMAAIFLNWLPMLIGLFTIVFFGLLKAFKFKLAWVISIIGATLQIIVILAI